MTVRWDSDVPVPAGRFGLMDWLRVLCRGAILGALVFGGLLVLLLLRLIERPLFRLKRPVTPWITVFVCRFALRIMGLPLHSQGARLQGPGIWVANHTSWLDILVLNAREPLYFVSKSEVAGWAGIGWLARATGTVFIERNPAKARDQKETFEARLLAGHRLLFFPEGTSTDGQQVLSFKSTLFAALFAPSLRDVLSVQPVSTFFHAPNDEDARFYGWFGDMGFGPHLLRVLALPRQGHVTLFYHPPLKVADYADRKALAAATEAIVRAGHQNLGRAPGQKT
ncbi:MAG: 1-acyl-sn-glycerol-3-phosphate acyltransferase [Epibacterium sp.]|nr:1-acyl-sn-glycerol-3-phosphate acyltransferase [Epibacterium sp.]NQX72164.1 1-acyl-sn-glycerol-3-phosphate acyltransferase [Epibacterium sp.]